jgi:hypothetical protein
VIVFKIIFYLILFYNISQASDFKKKCGKRIGILSVFPKKGGLFFQERALWVQGAKRQSIFPEKEVCFYDDVNKTVGQFIAKVLKGQNTTDCQFIPVTFSDPKTHLSGSMIEGWWGVEANSVHVSGVKELFEKQGLDSLIVIAPVTYYVPPIQAEGSGMNFTFCEGKIFFSACYTVMIFVKTKNGCQKIYGSIKQVYTASNNKSIFEKNLKKYHQKQFDTYDTLMQKNFLPYLGHQVLNVLEHLSEKKEPKHLFPKPYTPWHYWLPH